MSENTEYRCMCPGCRYFRQEISAEAYAWYLKGCIETAETYSRFIGKEDTLDDARKLVRDDRFNVDCAYSDLERMLSEGSIRPDIALSHPADFIPRT